jgi:two-component system CheB/CheR fusion protein
MKHTTQDTTAIVTGGEMGKRIRAFAWEKTSLGPICDWPQSLKTAVNILLQSPVPLVMLWGKDGIMIYNDAYSIFAGKRHPYLLGSKVVEGWPEVADFNRNVMKHGLAGKTLSYKDQQLTLYRNNIPEEVWMDLNYSPIMDESGKPAGVLAIVVETTQRVLAEHNQQATEDELEFERDRLQNIFLQAPAAIAVVEGADHTFVMANPLYQKLSGRTEKQLLGKPGRKALPELVPQGIWDEFDKAYKTGKAFIGKDFIAQIDKHNNGKLETGYFDFVAQPLKRYGQHNRSILIHAVEVTEQVTARKSLREVNQQLETIIRSSPLAIYVLDATGRVTLWNNVAEELFGWREEEIIGKQLPIVPEEKIEEHKLLIARLQQGKSFTRDLTRKRKDGSLLDLIISANPIVDEQGKTITIIAIAADITERKRLERQKDEFLGIASHELKTPVTSIKAYGQVLQRIFAKEGNNRAVSQLEKMDAQIDKLTLLISDLLDVTKIQSGKLMMQEEEFDINELITTIVDELQLTTTRHTLEKKLARTKMIYADRERIGQVLTNLITNAIKYSPHTDRIYISSKIEKDTVTVCVQDFGVGIPVDKKEKVFEQFFRVSGEKQQTSPGLGLGLYISSEIIKRQEGKIWVESVEGKGSTFCFCLPLKRRKRS